MKKYIISMPQCQKCKMLKAQNPDIEVVEFDVNLNDLVNFARGVGIKSMPFIVITGEPEELDAELKKE